MKDQFTEMFAKDSDNIAIIFEILDDFTFQTRWSAVKFLKALVENQKNTLQDCVLQTPRGISILMDLITDSREVIRNDVILLLTKLIDSNANIQKIIVFESGFDHILEIIDSEGAIEGGIVVEDCLNLLLNLLETNSSNQNFFKEANYIKNLTKYFDLRTTNSNDNGIGSDLDRDNSAANWTVQKSTNLSLLLRLLRALVSPTNQHQFVQDCQNLFNNCGLLHRLCAILMLPGVPADLLSEVFS